MNTSEIQRALDWMAERIPQIEYRDLEGTRMRVHEAGDEFTVVFVDDKGAVRAFMNPEDVKKFVPEVDFDSLERIEL